MSVKLVVLGALVFFVVNWATSFVTGPLVHEGILYEPYMATESFWRPELVEEPPDMAALLPYFIPIQLLNALIFAGLFGCYRSALNGAPWKKGAIFGLSMGIFLSGIYLAFHFVFNLPAAIWLWWAITGTAQITIAGAAVGWATGRWAPEAAA